MQCANVVMLNKPFALIIRANTMKPLSVLFLPMSGRMSTANGLTSAPCLADAPSVDVKTIGRRGSVLIVERKWRLKMRRLIDAEKLQRDGWILKRYETAIERGETLSLMGVPKVDAVEVVRCKDCKYYPTHFYCGGKIYRVCPCFSDLGEDGYCSAGIRREEAEDAEVH